MDTSDRSRGVVGIFILIFVLFLIFIIFSFFTIQNLKGVSSDDDFSFENGQAPIGVVEVNNVIMESKKTILALHKAEKDPTLKAIILRINSPGGAVGPTQEIYEEIIRIDKKIPVYASMGTVAASGGYYIAAATRKIYANAGTLTGSIGVIMQFMGMKRLYDFAKLDPNTLKAGKYKDIGSPFKSMSEKERALMMNMLAGVHDQFINDINSRRKERIKGNLRDHAQGQIFSGAGALEAGLIDEIAGLWEAGRRIHKDMKMEEDFDLKFIKYKKKFKFEKFFEEMEESLSFMKSRISGEATQPMFIFGQ